MTLKVTAYGLSDVGLVRQNNEDVWSALPNDRFYVLADGMGGHKAGEVAARETVNELCKIIHSRLGSHVTKKNCREATLILRKAISQVNTIIYELSRTDDMLQGMGTTLCCMYVHEAGVVYAHVGDSRIYLLQNQKLSQLTRDHSLLRDLLELEKLSEQQAADFIYKNIITKAIGTEPLVEPDIGMVQAVKGDIFLMCTDGLSDLLMQSEIEEFMNQSSEVHEIAQNLVSRAKEKGGFDNITVVVVKLE